MPGQPVRPPSGTIVSLLEKAGVKVFSVWTFTGLGQELPTLQPDIATWKKPSLTLIKDTTLGTAPFTFYYPKGSGMMMRPGPNGPVMIDLGEAIGGVMQEQFDAVLYLGPKTEITYAELPKSLCADPEYVEMRAAACLRCGGQGHPPRGLLQPPTSFARPARRRWRGRAMRRSEAFLGRVAPI